MVRPLSFLTGQATICAKARWSCQDNGLVVEYLSLVVEYISLVVEYISLIVEYISLVVEYLSARICGTALVVEYLSLLVLWRITATATLLGLLGIGLVLGAASAVCLVSPMTARYLVLGKRFSRTLELTNPLRCCCRLSRFSDDCAEEF